MNKCTLFGLTIFLSISLFVSSVFAVTITGTTVGKWQNVEDTTGNSVFSLNNSDQGSLAYFNWGTTDCPTCVVPPTPFDNQFTFDGVGSDGEGNWSAVTDVAFLLGEFTYRNGSTINSIGIEGVDLSVDMNIVTPLGATAVDTFKFDITNTQNNTGNPVTDGDIVTVTNGMVAYLFTYLDVAYYLEVLGFSKDGGNTITADFSSPEGQTAGAGLYAKITGQDQTNPIPEPSTISLLGAAAYGLLRRRKQQSA